MKLYRSKSNKMLAGVLGGFANAFKVDATILRLVYATLTIFLGIFPLFILYILAAIIIPIEPDEVDQLEDGEKEKAK
ncbi:PspC domain-containing protein [Bacillus toyonensis]|uniref:PspC domain-containing protein n=1 Tax=Bacillus toyonensis TaxID=155322 RepID=UPI002E1C5E9F|nr:PspC domain-containing protein [Bacillus toyonensis]